MYHVHVYAKFCMILTLLMTILLGNMPCAKIKRMQVEQFDLSSEHALPI